MAHGILMFPIRNIGVPCSETVPWAFSLDLRPYETIDEWPVASDA